MLVIVRSNHLWNSSRKPVSKNNIEDLITYMILGILIGGRLGYCIFYTPTYFFENPQKIFFLWEGGMSFHGGLIGVIIATILFAKKKQHNSFRYLDIVSLVNITLSGDYQNSADLNQDNNINILDIVTLVNLILGN